VASESEDLERQIAEWRGYAQRRREVHGTDVEELEDHLRSTVAELTEAGLRTDEAFLIAVKRMGSLDELSREFAREHSDRLWKQLVLTGGPDAPTSTRSRRELLIMICCALGAVVAIKLPALFGLDLQDDPDFYARNIGLFALAPLAVYFAWQRRVNAVVIGLLAVLFAAGVIGANAYSLNEHSQSFVLTALHLPLALWLVAGIAYVGGDLLSERKRMDFIRFTGEWFVYFVLIALGGGVLTAVTAGTFNAIGINIEDFLSQWLLPCGGVAGVVVAAWLVEAKQSVVEIMAPVLTRVFTPLFTIVLLALLVGIGWTSRGIDVNREVLILFDLLLVVILGLLLYSISARDPSAPPGMFDRLQLVLVTSALVIDVLVLMAITGRISEWGSTPNKIAAFGENVILLTNLAWSAFLLLGFVRRRAPFAPLERWQTNYLGVYAVWAWAVVLVLPPLLNFV
jgi:hypothetical protein